MCMYTCKRMSCIYSMSCTYLYMCISSQNRSQHQFARVSDGDDSAKGWKSLFENVGVFEVHELHEFFVHSEHRGLVYQIVIKISVSSGDNLVGTTVNALPEAHRNCAPMDPLQVVAILERYPKRARSGSLLMKYVFNTGPISTTHFSRQVKGCASQLGPPLHIPSPSGPACSPATLPSPRRRTWNRGVSEDRRVLGRKMLFWREKIVISNRRELTYTPPGGSLWEGEGNYQNATMSVTIPGSIPGNYG